jgi:vacuolar protein sorting-associated protein 45
MALDVSAVVKKYILKMLKDCSVGMKALVLDDFTMNVVSVVFSQTELLQAEVATFNTSSRYFRVTS